MSLPVYVICCDELPRRKEAALRHLADVGVRAVPFRAAHGTTWGLDTTKEFDPGKRISPGHVSLNLAHWTLWQHLALTLKGPDDAAVVFEDDAVCPPDFWTRLSDLRLVLLRDFPDWQFVFLGLADQMSPGLWNKVTERVGRADGSLCRLAWPYGTHAYMVRKSALPVLMDRAGGAVRNIDQQVYGNVLQYNLIRWCATLPSIVTQRTATATADGTPEWAPSTITGYDGEKEPAPPPKGDEQVPYRQSEAVATATLLLTEPYPCLYRGEGLEIVRTADRRPVATWECARYASACHQKPGVEVPNVLKCETCRARTEYHPEPNRPRLPVPDGHFNPSIAMFGGKLILATRDSWGHSKVGLWELNNDAADWSGAWSVRAISSVGSPDPRAPRLEDPRLFVAPHPDTGEPVLHSSFSMPDGYPPKKVRVGYVRFSLDLQRVEHTEVFESPNDCAYEKNWMWGTGPDGKWYWVYGMKPDHVVISGDRKWVTPNPFQWTGGVMRGGAPAVLHNGEMVAFFHGCLKRPQGSVYTIGVYTYEPEPPYRILRQTPTPLVWPDLAMPDELVTKRLVTFPGGVVKHAGCWFVATGVDDTYCRILRLPFDLVDEALNKTAIDQGGSESIRDTAIAKGVRLS